MNDTGVNLDAVRRIADAVLYEGYILYPYRASAQKNRSRWQFGVVMAPGYAAVDPSESSFTQTECVLEHSGQPAGPGHPPVPAGPAAQHRGRGVAPGPALGRGDRARDRVHRRDRGAARPGPGHGVLGSGRGRSRTVARRGVRGPPPGTAGRRGVRAHHPGAGPVAGRPAPGPGREPDRGRARARAAGRGAADRAGRRARDRDRLRRGVHLDDRPAGVGQTRRGRVREHRRLARPGRPRRRAPGRAVLADHPVRPPGTGPGEPGRAVRRHRDRRDPHAAHARAVRRGEARGPGHRPARGGADRPGRGDGRADHGTAARHHPRSAWRLRRAAGAPSSASGAALWRLRRGRLWRLRRGRSRPTTTRRCRGGIRRPTRRCPRIPTR